MSMRHSLPIDLHTADDLAKARALRGPVERSRLLPLVIAILVAVALGALLPRQARAAQRYHVPVTVESGDAVRVDRPADAPVDLTAFLAGIAGTLDPASLQVVEVDSAGGVLDGGVPFQFDAAAGFDPATNAAGTLVFALTDTTPTTSTRHYRVLFDVVGACGDCPAPPVVPDPVSVDSLVYENQDTYRVSTPRGDWYYHRDGAGLASLIDADGQDWIGFRDIPGSGSGGEYRGIPNLVFALNNPSGSFFHPGFTNATTHLVASGPLKVTLRSVTDTPGNTWIVDWEFFRDFARMTVVQTGTSNGGNYWFLYEGTPGGALDAGDVVVRSDGTTTSAFDNGTGRWETPLPDPQWTYFRDTAGSRYLYVSDDQGDAEADSYRAMGPSIFVDPDMTVFGLGRVLDTSSNPLVGRLSGTGRTFTLGFGEDTATAGAEIAGAARPLVVTVGAPVDDASPVPDLPLARTALHPASPNPFNPSTRIAFTLGEGGPVRLTVYDLAGRQVRTLVDRPLGAGDHVARWDGRDAAGRAVPSGVYLSRLESATGVRVGKMTLLE